jgi:hypothetical protein
MIPERGYLTWLDLPVLGVAPIVGGRQLADGGTEWRASRPQAPPGLSTGAGTTISQRAPGHRLAAESTFQQTFSFAAQAVEADDWRHLLDVFGGTTAFTWFTEWPLVDVWRIRDDDPVRTTWQLSRWLPRDLFPSSVYPVRAAIVDVPDSPAPVGETLLTEIGSGVPGPGEILVPEGVRVEEVTTEDLAPQGPYRRLRIEYQPLYLVTLNAFESGASESGTLNFTATLLESIQKRNYRATS